MESIRSVVGEGRAEGHRLSRQFRRTFVTQSCRVFGLMKKEESTKEGATVFIST